MSTPPTKNELLETINRSWVELDEIIAGLSEEQLQQPGAMDNDWSFKDIMAHITAWELLAMDRIRAAQTGEPLKHPAIESDDFANALNAEIYKQNKDTPLAEVAEDFHETHARFIAQIEALDEGVLAEKLPFDWAGNLTFQVLISANTHWHYAEHLEAVEKQLEKQQSS
ncbi:MAG: ClbS/DfsB family four-helix bundle protein [Chloroflexi bacterium]|nr:ClbS/DfsB family four-helix bundle protein [Chloroflexota bacterium]